MGMVCGCLASILDCEKGVVYVACVGGVVCGGDLLALNLANLFLVSLLSILKCAQIF